MLGGGRLADLLGADDGHTHRQLLIPGEERDAFMDDFHQTLTKFYSVRLRWPGTLGVGGSGNDFGPGAGRRAIVTAMALGNVLIAGPGD